MLCVCLLSCDDSDAAEETSLTLVTALVLTDPQGVSIGNLGNPNTLTDDQFRIFPNPVNTQVIVSSPRTMSAVWILSGDA